MYDVPATEYGRLAAARRETCSNVLARAYTNVKTTAVVVLGTRSSMRIRAGHEAVVAM